MITREDLTEFTLCEGACTAGQNWLDDQMHNPDATPEMIWDQAPILWKAWFARRVDTPLETLISWQAQLLQRCQVAMRRHIRPYNAKYDETIEAVLDTLQDPAPRLAGPEQRGKFAEDVAAMTRASYDVPHWATWSKLGWRTRDLARVLYDSVWYPEVALTGPSRELSYQRWRHLSVAHDMFVDLTHTYLATEDRPALRAAYVEVTACVLPFRAMGANLEAILGVLRAE